MVYFMGNYMYMYIQGWNMLESIITANDLFVMYDIACSLHSHLNLKFMCIMSSFIN